MLADAGRWWRQRAQMRRAQMTDAAGTDAAGRKQRSYMKKKECTYIVTSVAIQTQDICNIQNFSRLHSSPHVVSHAQTLFTALDVLHNQHAK